MSNILAIDSSHAFCSVALNCDGRIDSLNSAEPRQHAQELLPMIEELLARNHLAIPELDAIAVVSGPGSFTGLRIGAGVAQGLALGAQLPVLGVSSLAIMAYKAAIVLHETAILVTMKARDGELYSALYNVQQGNAVLVGDERVGGIESIPFSAIKDGEKVILVGDAQDLVKQACAAKGLPELRTYEETCVSDAATLGVMAVEKYRRGEGVQPALALPVYLKDQMDYQE